MPAPKKSICIGCGNLTMDGKKVKGLCSLCRSRQIEKEKKEKIAKYMQAEADAMKKKKLCRRCRKDFAPTRSSSTFCYTCLLKEIRERMMR